MPIYPWYCKACDHDTETVRPMSESDKAPDGGCEKCGGEVTKVIRSDGGARKFILKGDGWHDTEYTKHRSRK